MNPGRQAVGSRGQETGIQSSVYRHVVLLRRHRALISPQAAAHRVADGRRGRCAVCAKGGDGPSLRAQG